MHLRIARGTLPFENSRESNRFSCSLDSEGFRRFYDQAYPMVYAYMYPRCGRSTDTARDLTQETFVSIVSSLQNGAVPDDPLPWAMSIAKRRLVDYYRAKHRMRSSPKALAQAEGTTHEWTSDLEVWLENAMERLPARQRAAVVLRYMDGLPVGEVAEFLGVSYRATESVLARARSRLANDLAEWKPR